MSKPTVAIVGGGISGLHTADELLRQDYDITLYEARARTGGRVLSQGSVRKGHDSNQGGPGFDLGPSWFWQGQTHIQTLIKSLGLESRVFEQYLTGDGLYEPVQGQIKRGHLGFSMAGSMRIEGGLQELITSLVSRINAQAHKPIIKLNSPVQALTLHKNPLGNKTIEVSTSADSKEFDHVILALPPRLALQHIKFSPALSIERIEQLNDISTWMAGQAKVVVEYSRPFWRELGLSGDVISQRGPLAEIHDASSNNSEAYALFGFLSTPPHHRRAFETQKETLIKQQLVRLFGAAAASPKGIFYQNWAREAFTATSLDQTIPRHHPRNTWPTYTEQAWGNHLIWSGSESAPSHFNGYIEGALEASCVAIERLVNRAAG